jgi:hypothetical protein
MLHYEHWETDADKDPKLMKLLDPYIEYGYATLQDISFIMPKFSASGKNIFRTYR